jgi:hypothetical protein
MDAVATLLELARVIYAAPDTVETQRILEQLDREAISLRQAIDELGREIGRRLARTIGLERPQSDVQTEHGVDELVGALPL